MNMSMDKPIALNSTEGTRSPQVENAKMRFITKDKYSFTFASSCMGRFVDKPLLSNDKKNLIANGIIK